MATNNKLKLRQWQKRECGRKRRYGNFEQATRPARHMTVVDGSVIAPYVCNWCGWVHIGHRPMEAMYCERYEEVDLSASGEAE